MRLEQLRKAYKIAEDVSVDYGDKTPEEIKELDDALDTVFKLAKEAILKAEAIEIEPQDMSKEEKRYKLNVRLKSGKEFNFTCSGYSIDYNELSGIVTRFKFENGRGDCPVYINTIDIESISVNNKEVEL